MDRIIRRLPPLSLVGIACFALLGGCLPATDSPTLQFSQPAAPVPPARQHVLPDPNPAYTPASLTSEAVGRYYARLQQEWLNEGLLRQDSGAPTVDAATLARDFEAIALFDEYTSVGGSFVHRRGANALRRWEKPVRVATVFGASVPDEQRAVDRRTIANFTTKLARATRHDIRSAAMAEANFFVLVLGEDDRPGFADRLEAAIPEIDPTTLRVFRNMPRNQLCIAITFPDAANSKRLGKAVAVVRAEHPSRLRRSCIHEEMAQALGLPNDSPAARPSIFNDDEEFGLLTTHDEMLLRMLYDRRLRPGMTLAEAAPIVQQIAREMSPDRT